MKLIKVILVALIAMLPGLSYAVNDEGTTITLEPNQWATFCSSIDVDVVPWYNENENVKVKAYRLVGIDLNTMCVNAWRLRENIKSGTGMLLHNVGNNTVTITVTKASSQYINSYRADNNALMGVLEDTPIQQVEGTGNSAKYNYYLSVPSEGSNQWGLFKVPSDGITIPAGKAYCQLYANEEKAIQDYLSRNSNAKVGFEIIDNPETTGINEVKNEEGSVKNQNVYDLSGRLVGTSLNGLKPGLYILNNRKVVVR